MKKLLLMMVVALLAGPALAQKKDELNYKARQLGARLESLQDQPEAAIPVENLQKAVGIVLMERVKGGLVFGYEKGFGVALVKNEKGAWSPLAFMSSHEGSFGAQIGGKNSFVAILFMNEEAKQRLVNPEVDFGGEATGTGGDESERVEETFTDAPPILVYGVSSGVYGGATIKGGTLEADDKANRAYYGQFYSSKEILLEGKVKPTEVAVELAKRIEKLSQPAK